MKTTEEEGEQKMTTTWELPSRLAATKSDNLCAAAQDIAGVSHCSKPFRNGKKTSAIGQVAVWPTAQVTAFYSTCHYHVQSPAPSRGRAQGSGRWHLCLQQLFSRPSQCMPGAAEHGCRSVENLLKDWEKCGFRPGWMVDT